MTDGGPFLIFELGSLGETPEAGTFGLSVSHVLQVIETEWVSFVPLAPGLTEGIINHHGRIVTVFDPAPLLGLDAQPQPVTQVVILRRGATEAGNVGLKVSRVREIVASDALEAVDVTAGPCAQSVARRENRLIQLIDHEDLLEGLYAVFGSGRSGVGARRGDPPGADAGRGS